jgi:phosphoribosylanthranilate isomerase
VIVKVCGVRTPAVAEVAVAAGADWIGLVFEPKSPRHVDDAAARAVVAAVAGRAELIGVFVAPLPATCEAAAARYGLAAVQVHGAIAAGFVNACDVPVIRGLNVSSASEAMTMQWWPDLLVLLDAPAVDGELPGGTGRQVDRRWAAEVARHRRIVLAGGLGPDDVGEAIAAVRPDGVDASSGLESRRGEKDVERVRAYVQAARAAFARVNNGS